MSLEVECLSATSRNSEKQDPQEAKEKVDQYLTKEAAQPNNKWSKGLKKLASVLKKIDLSDIFSEKGSMKINVTCRSLEILDRLWDDYRSGHLSEVAEECLITGQVKDELGMEAIKLKTTILEEDYLACKSSLSKIPG